MDLRQLNKRDIVREFVTHVSLRGFEQHVSGERVIAALVGFPAPAIRGRSNLWIAQDILDWLESLRTFKPLAVDTVPVSQSAPALGSVLVKRSVGRPRKVAAEWGAQ